MAGARVDDVMVLQHWPVSEAACETDLAQHGPSRSLPTAASIAAAADIMAEWATPTPIREIEWDGEPVALKDETTQPTGSFKVRGAFAAMAAAKAAGVNEVIACSAGNHGAGLVWAAQRLGMTATICVPENCPAVKRAKMEKGARVVVCLGGYDDAEKKAREMASSQGLPFVSPFDDEAVMAGNGGTLARELERQLSGPLTVLVPVGGGGLLGGMMIWAQERELPWHFVAVQSEASPAFAASLRDDTFYGVWSSEPTVAEGLEGGAGLTSVRLARRFGISSVVVREAAIVDAMRRAFVEHGLTMEGSAAVVLAALPVLRRAGIEGRVVGIVTGGNVETDESGLPLAAADV